MNGIVAKTAFLFFLFFTAESYAFSCKIATTSVNFGNYDVFSNFNLDSTGTIIVDCNNKEERPMHVTITLNAGRSGSFNPRQMTSSRGSDRLRYNLYIDPSHVTIWGDGTGGSSFVTALVDRTSTLKQDVYGRIPPRQNVGVGDYRDVLTATVLW